MYPQFEQTVSLAQRLSSPPHLISSKDSCYSTMEPRIKTSTFQPQPTGLTDTGGTRTWRLQAGSQPPRVTEEMPSSNQTERTSMNDKKNEQTTEEKTHHCCDGQSLWQMVSGLWHTPYSWYSWNAIEPGMLGLMQVHKKTWPKDTHVHASPGLPGVCGDLQYEVYASLNSRANKVCSTSVICMDCFLFPSPRLTPGSINHSIHSWLETQPSGQANLTGRWSSFCAPAGFWNWVDHPFVTQTQWSLNRCKQDWQLRTLRKGCKLSKYCMKISVQL